MNFEFENLNAVLRKSICAIHTYLRKSFAMLVLVLLSNSCAYAAGPWELEANQATVSATSATSGFTTIDFTRPFAKIPVVIVLATDQGGNPADLRIRSVSKTGFELTIVEPPGNDGPHAAMTFHYVAMTPGVHTLPTGQTVVAGSQLISSIQSSTVVGPSTGFTTVGFGATLANTASVVTSIQTMNSETNAVPGTFSAPWITPLLNSPSASSVQIALERSEVDDGTVLPETVGYIAFPSGLSSTFFDDNGATVTWSASTTLDNIVGFNDACVTNTFSTISFGAARVVAGKISRDGGDGGWLRRCSISGTTIGLQVDEDIDNDSDRNHTNERAALLAFSSSFHAVFEEGVAAKKIVELVEDPVNGTFNPFAIPGARVRYSVHVANLGNLPVDNNTITFVDELPEETELIVTDIAGGGSGPVLFIDGTTGSALTYTFSSLGSGSDDIDFSNNNGVSFGYTPVAGGNGSDPDVTHIRVRPKGAFAGASPVGSPSFELEFDVLVR